jgi:hypothetical protein
MLRPDSAAIHNAIILFLRGKVTKLAVTEKKEKIVTSPNEIADKLKIDRETAKKHLEQILNKEIDGVAISCRVDDVDIIIRDDTPTEKSETKLPPISPPRSVLKWIIVGSILVGTGFLIGYAVSKSNRHFAEYDI